MAPDTWVVLSWLVQRSNPPAELEVQQELTMTREPDIFRHCFGVEDASFELFKFAFGLP
jgi:hypothetical protein